jgi:putative transposase
MTYDPDKHQRRSNRLSGYDYSSRGAYFVTVCSQERGNVFGDINANDMNLNHRGQIAYDIWCDLPSHYRGITLYEFVVMPNHLHGIIVLGEQMIAADDSVANYRIATLGEIIRAYKARTTHKIRGCYDALFAWQRNYYEHIIRNDEDMIRIRQYIIDNPLRWALDRYHPSAPATAGDESPDWL